MNWFGVVIDKFWCMTQSVSLKIGHKEVPSMYCEVN